MNQDEMNQILDKILDYRAELRKRENETEKQTVSREKFTLLLSGIPSFRVVPGIPVHMGYDELYHCESEEDKALVKEHLEKLFNVVDEESLVKACYLRFSGSREYEQFMTFWKEAPLFDPSKLEPQGVRAFERCKSIAEYFYPVLEENGFYAWDIGERILLCRTAVACGIISDEQFYKITDEWVRLAQVFYCSFEEYAISCLCGGIYDLGRYESTDLTKFLDMNMKIVEQLINHGGPWQKYGWYKAKEREWARVVEKNLGCYITKRALEKECVGYMYRTVPLADKPDSGWRFMYGDEDQEYIQNLDNTEVVGINTVCNFQPDVLAYIHAKPNTGYVMDVDGWKKEKKKIEV